MGTFRKKPVVVEAMEWTGDAATFSTWLSEVDYPRPDPFTRDRYFQFQGSRLAIVTLEGTMMAEPGDYVIRGVRGEFYPCKPDIFAVTYEHVESVSTKSAQRATRDMLADMHDEIDPGDCAP